MPCGHPHNAPLCCRRGPLCFLCAPATFCPLPRSLVVRGPSPKPGCGTPAFPGSPSAHHSRHTDLALPWAALPGDRWGPSSSHTSPSTAPWSCHLTPRADVELSAPAAGVSCGELWGAVGRRPSTQTGSLAVSGVVGPRPFFSSLKVTKSS